jgi:hypothetical protein
VRFEPDELDVWLDQQRVDVVRPGVDRHRGSAPLTCTFARWPGAFASMSQTPSAFASQLERFQSKGT